MATTHVSNSNLIRFSISKHWQPKFTINILQRLKHILRKYNAQPIWINSFLKNNKLTVRVVYYRYILRRFKPLYRRYRFLRKTTKFIRKFKKLDLPKKNYLIFLNRPYHVVTQKQKTKTKIFRKKMKFKIKNSRSARLRKNSIRKKFRTKKTSYQTRNLDTRR